MVLFVLSHNYYESAPCLNEMGAAWATSNVYNSILTPNFEFKKLAGAIDASKISFHLNDSNGLDKFKDSIIQEFNLKEIDYKIKFISNIEELAKIEATTLNTQIRVERINVISQNTIELQYSIIRLNCNILLIKQVIEIIVNFLL